MKSSTALITLTLLLGLNARSVNAAETLETLTKQATEAVEAFKRADSTLAAHFEKAAGYAVFAKVGKGGFVFGGARGQGVVYEQGKVVGKVTLTQATVGAQIGGQVFREVIFLENSESLTAFKQSNLEMSAQVGAVAAAEGAAKNAKYRDGVLVFTQPVKGLMAEASVGGQKFKFEPAP